MTTYMYGEDPAEAMDSAAARLALGERSAGDLPRTHWQYRSEPWGVRGGTRAVHCASPTTGITPRTLEMLREIREVVEQHDSAVLSAYIERDEALAAIYKDYNL